MNITPSIEQRPGGGWALNALYRAGRDIGIALLLVLMKVTGIY